MGTCASLLFFILEFFFLLHFTCQSMRGNLSIVKKMKKKHNLNSVNNNQMAPDSLLNRIIGTFVEKKGIMKVC